MKNLWNDEAEARRKRRWIIRETLSGIVLLAIACLFGGVMLQSCDHEAERQENHIEMGRMICG